MDVFFVLSGFLITGIIVREVQKTGSVSLAAFWARRARRLLPAATLVSLVTLMLGTALDSPFTEQSHAKSALAFATYWSNMLFVRRGTDYFDQSLSTDPYLHTWSLAVEEQYYLVFAPLCLVLAAAVRRTGPGRFRRHLFSWTIGVTVVSFVGCLILTARNPLLSFYGLPSRAWEFGIGGVLALNQRASRAVRESSRWDQGISIIALLAVIAAWFLATNRTPHPGWITLLPVVGTAGLIHVGARGPTLVGRLLQAPVMRLLGRLSYSWYLWHWPITIYWAKLVPFNQVPLILGMPLLSLVLAQLTYVTIEAPARHARWLQRARTGLIAAVVLALTTSVASTAAVRHAKGRLLGPEYAFILEARDAKSRMYLDGCGRRSLPASPTECSYGTKTSDTCRTTAFTS